MSVQIDEQQIKDIFIELTQIDSPGFHERSMADVLVSKLETLGFDVTEDSAASVYGSEAGNIYGLLRGTRPDKRPVLFSSHMDTVEPSRGKKPLLNMEEGIITSDGSTVLGADDVCGIVEILEGIKAAKAAPDGHGDIEVLFTFAEEHYGSGSNQFDYSTLISKDAYVLDMSGDVGKAAVQAPSIISFKVLIRGKSSHAGYAPEKGINALQAAADAISLIHTGRVTPSSTLNIGTIRSGIADNIVPEECRCTGEVRSFDHNEALRLIENIRQIFSDAADQIGAKADFSSTVHINAYQTPEDSDVCRDFQNACSRLGLAGELVSSHGGSDNNVFAANGVKGIVLSCGMYETHSTKEYARISELIRGAQLVAEIIVER